MSMVLFKLEVLLFEQLFKLFCHLFYIFAFIFVTDYNMFLIITEPVKLRFFSRVSQGIKAVVDFLNVLECLVVEFVCE